MSFNTFLDTTPRQWLQKIPTARLPFATLASVIVHVAAFLGLVLAPQSKILAALENSESPTLETVEVEMSASSDVEPVYDGSSDIVMPVEKKKPKTEAQKLFDKYRILNVRAIAKSKSQPISQRTSLQRVIPQNIPLEKMDKSNDKDQVTQYLGRYQHQFQTCYDSALLKDSSLNGRVRFSLKVSKVGAIAESVVRFDGVGQNAIRHNLESCLQVATHQIQFPATMTDAFNREIHFQAVLSL